MPNRSSTNRVPQDEAQLAESITDEPTTEEEGQEEKPAKNLAAVALGRLGGLKGGKARAAKLSPKRRKQIAKKAAEARWSKRESKD